MFITEKNSESTPTGQQRGTKRGTEKTAKETKKVRWNDEEGISSKESDSSLDTEDETSQNKDKQQQIKTNNSKQKDFEIVPVEDNSKYIC